MQPYGPAVLRLAVRAVFVAHGAQKLFGVWGGGGLAGTAAYFTQLGLTPAFPLAVFVAVVEFVGGLLLVAGALTLVAAGALAIEMIVAIWQFHLGQGFFLNWSLAPAQGYGYEYNVVLIGALVSLMLTGAGALVAVCLVSAKLAGVAAPRRCIARGDAAGQSAPRHRAHLAPRSARDDPR